MLGPSQTLTANGVIPMTEPHKRANRHPTYKTAQALHRILYKTYTYKKLPLQGGEVVGVVEGDGMPAVGGDADGVDGTVGIAEGALAGVAES